MTYLGREEFSAKRRTVLDEAESELTPAVKQAIDHFGDHLWWNPVLDKASTLFDETFREEAGTAGGASERSRLISNLRSSLTKTSEPEKEKVTTQIIVRYVATATINAATEAAAAADQESLVLEWVTMHDSHVRETHQKADGQRRALGAPFHVGGAELRYPGDTTAPIEEWIGCRCVLRPDLAGNTASVWHPDTETTFGGVMTEPTETAPAPSSGLIPWHGVLTVEGSKSGDKRSFSNNSLRNRDLPLPLTWQKVVAKGHDGAVKVARMDSLTRVPIDDKTSEIRAHGVFLPNAEADEVIGEMAMFPRVGVSVDLDDATFDVDEASQTIQFTDARICSASIVIIPAFDKAWVSLGEPPAGFMGDTTEVPVEPQAAAAEVEEFAVSDSSWDGSAGRFTPEQWKSSCILHMDDSLNKSSHKLPIKEPNGDLSRAGVHAAASRISSVDAPAEKIASAKSALRGAYNQLGETPPDTLSEEDIETFDRGPGWVTHPVETKRIHDYWTVPGQPGYEKIAWGTEGDFNRCRVEIGQEIAEKTPEKLRFINAQCAQWQHDAIGVWPGKGEKLASEATDAEQMVSLTASVSALPSSWVPKREWFLNPNLTEPTPLTLEDHPEGTRVYGHLAEWNSCHLDFPGVCVSPPPLDDGGAEFMLGRVQTDDGVIFTGPLTLGGGHADTTLGLHAAKEHYDDATTSVADVVVGQDEIGIWFSGFLHPDVTPAQRYALTSHQVSGDWREKMGAMPLIAAHVVNTPGFGIKPQVHTKDGYQTALVAAGGVRPAIVASASDVTPDPAELIAKGIETYVQRTEARQRIAAAAEQVGATPAQRLNRLRETIEED